MHDRDRQQKTSAGFNRRDEPVREWEIGIGGDHRTHGQRRCKACGRGRVPPLLGCDPRGIHAAHLTGPDADSRPMPGVHDGV